MDSVYCEQHLMPVIKISRRPVIIDDVKRDQFGKTNHNCKWQGCAHQAIFKLRFYRNPPFSQGAAIV